ncbi:XRE family transcriptional regulator [Yoonia sp.]|uniref:XRE family transcriptional regulator n=1 Tax=Yoonia sp. TaxID=2212373 RepID=UPI00391DF267
MLGIDQRELCKLARISIVTLRRLEGPAEYAQLVSPETARKVKEVLEAHGLIFLNAGETSPGTGVAISNAKLL